MYTQCYFLLLSLECCLLINVATFYGFSFCRSTILAVDFGVCAVFLRILLLWIKGGARSISSTQLTYNFFLWFRFGFCFRHNNFVFFLSILATLVAFNVQYLLFDKNETLTFYGEWSLAFEHNVLTSPLVFITTWYFDFVVFAYHISSSLFFNSKHYQSIGRSVYFPIDLVLVDRSF